MCTAITFHTRDHYFGRNLDLEYSNSEILAITPRSFPLSFRHKPTLSTHYAMIGIACMPDSYPLYYEAVNEKGLAMAGLNFPQNACYHPLNPQKDNIAPFELIPWVLSQCATLSQARRLLASIHLCNEDYNEQFPLTPLHWILSDPNASLTLEPVRDGMRQYENPVGVLTNNPTFDIQLFQLNNYMQISSQAPENHFSSELSFCAYSRGMGGIGLPGDWSSPSRFVKAVFTKTNSVCPSTESASVSQFFHILSAVEHPRGCVRLDHGSSEITVYSCCCNMDKGIYYYKTYDNSQISAVSMHRENLMGSQIISYPLRTAGQIYWQN